MRDIYISTLSFQQDEVMRYGQIGFIDTVVGVGASGIGFQRELIQHESEFHLLREKVNHTNLKVAYATSQGLFDETGSVNKELVTCIEEGKILGTHFLKMTLGSWCEDKTNWEEVRSFVQKCGEIVLVIVNDQTNDGGKIEQLERFIKCVHHQQINIQLAFDCGNWTYMNEDVEQALDALGEYVALAHLKRVVKNGQVFMSVPLNNEKEATWKGVMNHLEDCPVCIDFSLYSSEEGKYYVDLLKKYVGNLVTV